MQSSYTLQCDLFFTIRTDFGYVTQLTGNIKIPVQQLMLEGLYHLDELENNGNSKRKLINTPNKSNKYQSRLLEE